MNASGSQGTTVSTAQSFLGTDMPSLLLSDTVLSRFAKQQHLDHPSFKDIAQDHRRGDHAQSAVMPITYKSRYAKAAIDGANALASDLRDYYREISTRPRRPRRSQPSSALDGERAKIEPPIARYHA